MAFDSVISDNSTIKRLIQYAHDTVAKGFEESVHDIVYRFTSYRDRGDNSVKVVNTFTGLYTLYTLEQERWVQAPGF